MVTRFRTHRSTRLVVALATMAATGSVLSACSSGSQDVSQASPETSVSPQRMAGLYRDSQICVVNNSSAVISVAFTQKDASQGEGEMQPKAGPAAQACANGWFANGHDVQGNVTTTKPNSILQFGANNPRVGKPDFLGDGGGDSTVCLGFSTGASVGDSDTWDNGILKYTVTRESDTSAYVRFLLVATDTQNPSPDGIARVTC